MQSFSVSAIATRVYIPYSGTVLHYDLVELRIDPTCCTWAIDMLTYIPRSTIYLPIIIDLSFI
jgi:hypothetical protein